MWAMEPLYLLPAAVDMGDHVVITNTKDIVLTGNKWDKKLYRHHTGYVCLRVSAWRNGSHAVGILGD